MLIHQTLVNCTDSIQQLFYDEHKHLGYSKTNKFSVTILVETLATI